MQRQIALFTFGLMMVVLTQHLSGEIANVDLLLDSSSAGVNRFDFTIEALNSSDTESADISGNALANLDVTYDAGHNVSSVTEMTFTGGNLAMTDENFSLVGGLIQISTVGLGGQAITPSPPGTVTGNSFATQQHAIELDQGQVQTNVSDPINLAAAPVSGTTVATGTLNVSLNSIDVNNMMATYDVQMTLPVDFMTTFVVEDVPVFGNVNVDITVDNGSVVANGQYQRAVVCAPGDTDCDGDIDTVDLTTAITSFNGAGGTGKQHSDGDTDNDGDVDTVDLTTSIGNFTGALAGDPNVPDLIYDPATGNVSIDTEGQDVISFSLQGGPFNTGATDFGGLPAGLNDNIANQIGWTSFNIGSGLVGTATLGAILPAGLDLAGVQAALAGGANYGLSVVTGGGGAFEIIVPEPATMLFVSLGVLRFVRRRSLNRAG